MGSKGRGPPPNLRHPPPGPGMVYHDAFGPPMRNPPPGDFPPFDRLPTPEVLEQKIGAQHLEMQKLTTENQRLTATHVTLRRELAAAQHELQMLHVQIDAVKANREQETKGLNDKISRIEAEFQAIEPIKIELPQAQGEAHSLFAARQELLAKMQLLTQDLQRAHTDVQQIPLLLAELESLKKEYQQCRTTYEYESKLYSDHLESLQVMEKNYMTMSREVEKLRAELANTSNSDRQTGAPYGSAGYNENDATNNYAIGQNIYADGYYQGRGSLPTGTNVGGVPAVTSPQVGAQSVPPSNRPPYDGHGGQRGSGVPGYDTQRGSGLAAYEAQRGHGYDTMRGTGYDAQRAVGYEAYRGPGYDGYGAPVYHAQRGSGYDASSKGGAATQGQVAPTGNPHRPSTSPGLVGPGYDASKQGGNPARR
ncbi:protein FLX-like 2 [Capsicum chacoense]|uniref:protein FLX-like 2 n=1 Tax=Capsicum annuum TaxID=4072 RepID=UPI001FB124A1|nr:protein FLX-like 2 [Capsicum annuum]XP_016558961.2 protein FLX-like 2 [Capsicum annuum]XP_016558962.2 protein FLX-like 2 [Capsicum annuum]XP_047262361.1 protein FLX-like 2 [Capsicum annuum]XP_047262362.1 protein FLX-like 2 [Capsicum annuum]XP_047262363.1 protein FLX-like 2 [Capsicum annuum]KAF3650002.1 Protein FLX-like 2 [Capsicum annuum]